MSILGRETELAELNGCLDDAERGIGASLLLLGEPGVGKTALLRAAVVTARERGFGIVAGAGIEGDGDFGFAALARLFPDLFESFEGSGRRENGGFGRTATDLANFLEDMFPERPVLLAIDDAQWLDHSSAETLRILAGSLLGERVAMLVTARVGVASAFDSLDSRLLQGLPREVARDLLGHDFDARSEDELDRVLAATGGNPMALLSLRGESGWFDVDGTIALPARLDRALAAPFINLGTRDRATVVRVALAGPVVASIPDAADDLESASRCGLVNTGAVLRHPLIRSAVLARCSRDEVTHQHEVLAAAFDELGRTLPHDTSWLDRAAHHRALACVAPDSAVADELFASSQRARARGAFVEAGRLAERAVALHRDPLARDKMLAQAASNAWLGSDLERTSQLLLQGAGLEHLDAEAHAQWAIVRVQAAMWVDGPVVAREDLASVAELVSNDRPDLAIVMFFTATVAATLEPNAAAALALAERADALGSGSGALGFLADLGMGAALIVNGRSTEAELRLAPLDGLALELLEAPAQELEQLFLVLGTYDMIRERWADGLKILLSTSARARRKGSLTEAHAAGNGAAGIMWRRGDWARAYALMAAEEISPLPAARCLHLAQQCLLEAGMGFDDSCIEHAAAAIALGEPRSMGLAVHVAHWGLGLLGLGRGDYETAVRELHAAGAALAHAPDMDPGFSWWRADLIEALWKLGRRREAEIELEQLRLGARSCNRRSALAATDRLTALLGDGGSGTREARRRFESALATEEELAIPFAAARTLLCRAEYLSARGEQDAVAADATAARTRFERLGARAFAERARGLLNVNDANGSASAPAVVPPRLTDVLRPSELRVALALAEGLTTREAGEMLFLSAKTVDKHLQSTYRKLGIDNRAQLARRVGAEMAADAGSTH